MPKFAASILTAGRADNGYYPKLLQGVCLALLSASSVLQAFHQCMGPDICGMEHCNNIFCDSSYRTEDDNAVAPD